MKKRYAIFFLLVLLVVISIAPAIGLNFLAPVRPFIQLAGERYPTSDFPFGGLTNTFCASVLAYLVLLGVAFSAGARGRTSEEVPTGFYNFVEMVVEGGYNFVQGIIGDRDRTRAFFPFFMTFLLFLLTTNLMALVPGFDSVGLWENKPHFEAEKAAEEVIADAEGELAALKAEAEQEDIPLNQAVTDALSFETLAAEAAETSDEEELLHLVELEAFATETNAELSDEELSEEFAGHGVTGEAVDTALEENNLEELEHLYVEAVAVSLDAENIGDLSTSDGEGPGLLIRAPVDENNQKPEGADWTIVPFLRPAATDLTLNLALALVSMFMVQVYGIRYLGVGYLSKFFAWPRRFVDTFAEDPMQGIVLIVEPVVGIIELISEFAKVISFSFRLLGALFGGMVLLFVMAAILPLSNIVFYGLELFVGMVQAFVFAFLTVIFMKTATEHHGGHEEHEAH